VSFLYDQLKLIQIWVRDVSVTAMAVMLYVTVRKAKVGYFNFEILPWAWNVMSAQQTQLSAIRAAYANLLKQASWCQHFAPATVVGQ
jgi:hypothetical protein